MENKKKRLLSLLLAGVLSVGLLAGCSKDAGKPGEAPAPTPTPSDENKEAKDSIVIATGNETPSLSPTEHNALAGIYMNLLTYNTLFTVDDAMNAVPDLVDTYENTSDTEWLFHLKQGVKFHDGSVMTAEDVKASLERAKGCAEVANYTNTVETVEVVDENTVKVTTATPSATLLYDLGNHGNAILPKALIDSDNDFSKNPIGTGPYKFVSWTSGVELQFEAFDEYFGGAPAIKKMTWKIIPEGSSRTISLEAGEVDFVMGVEAVDVERIEASDKLATVSHESNIISWMNMNNEKPGMDNEALRHAINCAINKEDIVTVAANGQGSVAVAQVPMGMPGYSDENADQYDPEKAKEWLDKSGVDPSTVEFPILCSSESKKRVAEVIQANLKEVLGINATIESMDLATYVSAAAEGNFVAAIGGYSANDIVSFLKGVYHSRSIGSSNQTRTNDAAIDGAIDAIATTIDPAEREAKIQALAAQLNARCPQVPLYQGQNLCAFQADLQGVTLNSAGMTRFEKLSWK